jgi:hypothetical protein
MTTFAVDENSREFDPPPNLGNSPHCVALASQVDRSRFGHVRAPEARPLLFTKTLMPLKTFLLLMELSWAESIFKVARQ